MCIFATQKKKNMEHSQVINHIRQVAASLLAVLLLVGCAKPDRSEEVERMNTELTDLGFEDPELALARVDSVEQAGLFKATEANVTRACIYWNAGKCQMASFCCEQALEDADPKNDSSYYCTALGIMANYAMSNGDNGKGITLANEILSYIGDNRSRWAMTMRNHTLTMKAECEDDLKHPDEAELYYLESIDQLMEGALHPREWAEIDPLIFNILEAADFFLDNGRPEKALSLMPKADTVMSRLERIPDVPDYILKWRQNNLLIYQAIVYAANGMTEKAEALYLKHRQIEGLTEIDIAAEGRYLAITNRHDEAVRLFRQADSIYQADEQPITYDYINTRMSSECEALQKAGHTAEALALSGRIRQLSDSIRLQERRINFEQANEIQQQRDEIASRNLSLLINRIILMAALLVCLFVAYMFWRTYQYNKVLDEKNRRLVAEIEQREREQKQAIENLKAEPEESLTSGQKLYRRLCTLMADKQPYTDETLNRESLATLLGTNAKYVEQAIRECSHGETVGDFITRYRLEHVVQLLKTTDEAIALIGEEVGIPSRITLNRLFRNFYGMTCSEYRQATKGNAEGTIANYESH